MVFSNPLRFGVNFIGHFGNGNSFMRHGNSFIRPNCLRIIDHFYVYFTARVILMGHNHLLVVDVSGSVFV